MTKGCDGSLACKCGICCVSLGFTYGVDTCRSNVCWVCTKAYGAKTIMDQRSVGSCLDPNCVSCHPTATPNGLTQEEEIQRGLFFQDPKRASTRDEHTCTPGSYPLDGWVICKVCGKNLHPFKL